MRIVKAVAGSVGVLVVFSWMLAIFGKMLELDKNMSGINYNLLALNGIDPATGEKFREQKHLVYDTSVTE